LTEARMPRVLGIQRFKNKYAVYSVAVQ